MEDASHQPRRSWRCDRVGDGVRAHQARPHACGLRHDRADQAAACPRHRPPPRPKRPQGAGAPLMPNAFYTYFLNNILDSVTTPPDFSSADVKLALIDHGTDTPVVATD